jgi:hypothetical protein
MTYTQLQNSKKAQVFIEQLGKYVKARVTTTPFFGSDKLAVTLKGKFNKSFDFEIHINNEKDFEQYKIKA